MKPTASPNLWRPLRVTIFRNLLIADAISDAGAFMRNVGAAWLMVSLGAGPIYVALTQTVASLPYFLLALPAGAAGDIVDRRKADTILSTRNRAEDASDRDFLNRLITESNGILLGEGDGH